MAKLAFENSFFKNFNEAKNVLAPKEADPTPVYEKDIWNFENRLAIPFQYRNGNSFQSGILYVPRDQETKFKNGAIDEKEVNNLDIYGAETRGMSLTANGFKQLFKNNNNHDFQFYLKPAAEIKIREKGRNPYQEKHLAEDYDVGKYEAGNGDFVKKLRESLWGL